MPARKNAIRKNANRKNTIKKKYHQEKMPSKMPSEETLSRQNAIKNAIIIERKL